MNSRRDEELSNEDLAPTRPEQRTWNTWHIAALWVGMAVCIPTYTLGSGLIDGGISLVWRAPTTVAIRGARISRVPAGALGGQ